MRNEETIEAFPPGLSLQKWKRLIQGTHQHHDSNTADWGWCLPQGLTVQNAYTELWKGSKYVVVVVRNNTAYPQMIQKKASFARAIAATTVPEIPLEIGVPKKNDSINISDDYVPHCDEVKIIAINVHTPHFV